MARQGTSLLLAKKFLFVAAASAASLAGCGGGAGAAGSAPASKSSVVATPTPTSATATAPTPLPSGPPAGAACPTTNSNVALAGATQLAVGASRATGVAPLAVFFDASGSTSTATARPFHDIQYRWSFGETGSGTWSYGAKAGTASRNVAMGPVAAHVFESAGTFPITVSAFDGTNTATYSCNITVTSTEAEFAGNKTVCVSGVGNFAGCPTGAVQVSSSNPTTAVSGNIGTGNKRILFGRGETFNVGSSIAINRGGPSMLGAFGTGAKPIFTATSGSPIINLSSNDTPTGVSDWRFQDLSFNGGANGAIIFFGNGHASRVLLNRVDTANTQGSLTLAASHLVSLNSATPFRHAMWDEFYVVDSNLGSLYLTNGNGIFANGNRMAFIGNLVDTGGLGEHGMRTQLMNRGVVSNNTIQGIAVGRANLTIRGTVFSGTNTVAPGVYSEKVVVSDNKLIGGVSAGIMGISPQNGNFDERGRNMIVERNWFVGSSGTQSVLTIAQTDITVRNNLVYVPNNNGGDFVSAKDEDPNQVNRPTRVHVYNNSVFHASTSNHSYSLFNAFPNNSNLAGSTFDVRNNILYAPSAGNATMTGNMSAATITTSNNSSNVRTNPLFASTPPLTVENFRIGAGSYANSTGTNSAKVFSDFFGISTPAVPDMGASTN